MGCSASVPDRNKGGPSSLNPDIGGVSDAKNLRVKLVLLGDSGVGKSCIVLRFVRGQFDPTSKVTVGASFLSQTIALQDSTTVKFEIWDTAGQERYAALAPLYYRGAAVAVIVYDITSSDSFHKAQYWVKGTMAENFDLSKLPRAVKATALYKRLTNAQRKYYYGHLDGMSPVKESRLNEEFHVPGMKALYDRGWGKWLKLEGFYCEESVKEFLTTMEVVYRGASAIGVEGLVNKVKVTITKEGFNELFECAPRMEPTTFAIDGHDEFMRYTADYKAQIAEAYLKPGFTLEHKLAYSHLSSKAKILNAILANRVYSIKNPRNVYPERLALIYCIERNIDVNLGHHVVGTLIEAANNKNMIGSLMFPKTITLFCAKARVKVEENSPNWVFKDHHLQMYHGYEHPEYESEGDRERPRRRRRTTDTTTEAGPSGGSGWAGFQAAENEPCELTPFMQQMYIGRREERAYMARQEQFMEAQTHYMANQTLYMARQDQFMEAQTQFMERQRQFEAEMRARWATEGPRNMDEDTGGS